MSNEEARDYIIKHCNPDYPNGKTEWEQAINLAITTLEENDKLKAEDLPDADVPEIKVGKWQCSDRMFKFAVCSSCKWDSREPWRYANEHFKFCPNCGAKMEKEE